jgi:hypothetical protein
VFEHTERLLAASARQLLDAACETLPDDTRISASFVGGYNAMQAIQPTHRGSLDDHPLHSIVTNGAMRLELSNADLTLGLRLLTWEDHGRYQLEPSPATIEEAMAWARRVHDSALQLQAAA